MIKKYGLFTAFFFILSFSYAQQGVKRSYNHYNQLWINVNKEFKIGDGFRFGFDVPYRRQSVKEGGIYIIKNLNRYGFRLWTSRELSESLTLDFSPFAYFYDIPTTHEQKDLDNWQNEIRLTVRLRYAPASSIISHRYAVERKYRADHQEQRWKEYSLRYRLRINKGIGGDFRLIASDELFINMGKAIGYNIF